MRRPSRIASNRARRRQAAQVQKKLRPVEAAYVRALRGVVKAIHREYVRALEPYLEDIARTDAKAPSPDRLAYEASVRAAAERRALNPLSNTLDVLGAQVNAAIGPTVGPLFNRMSGSVAKVNAQGMGLFGITPKNIGLGDTIEKARDANIKLIENAHRVYAQQVRDIVGDPDNFGLRVEDLKDKILERGDVSESRAELIARDQTLKLNGNITQARQTAAGVSSYTWSTSLDERVRDEHAALEGQVFDWLNPPEPGHPGEDFQCRCVAIPVVEELEDVFADV